MTSVRSGTEGYTRLYDFLLDKCLVNVPFKRCRKVQFEGFLSSGQFYIPAIFGPVQRWRATGQFLILRGCMDESNMYKRLVSYCSVCVYFVFSHRVHSGSLWTYWYKDSTTAVLKTMWMPEIFIPFLWGFIYLLWAKLMAINLFYILFCFCLFLYINLIGMFIRLGKCCLDLVMPFSLVV